MIDASLILTYVLDGKYSSEAGRAATHDLALAHELGVELGAVESEVDVEVDAVKGTLGSVHALEVFFEVLSAEIRGQGDNLLDAWRSEVSKLSSTARHGRVSQYDIRGSLVYSGHTSSSQAYSTSSYMSVAPGATCRKKETLTGSPILTL